MTAIVLVSANGSPGATSLACAIGAIWPGDRSVVVAECDPSGGDLAARFSLSPDLGMTSWVLALRQAGAARPDLSDHLQQLPGGLGVLCGPIGADAGLLLDREIAAAGLGQLSGAEAGADFIVDCGRLGPHLPGQGRLIAGATKVVLLVRPEAASIAAARWAVDQIHAARPAGEEGLGLVVVGAGSFRASDIARALGLELLGTVPNDPTAAALLRGEPGGRRTLARSTLVRSAKRLVRQLERGTSAVERQHAR